MKFENMVAVAVVDFEFKTKRENLGKSNNFLVKSKIAKELNVNTWHTYERLTKKSVEKEVKTAKLNDRMIHIEYHKDDMFDDSYLVYVSLKRAIEIIEDENNFVFIFNVLDKNISDEYKNFQF